MMTAPISDILTRLSNALLLRKEYVIVPSSKIKVEIAKILKKEGFIKDYELLKGDTPQKILKIYLKYKEDGEPVITDLKRISKPGCRIYVKKDEIPRVLNGLGIAILTTSKGVLTDREARRLGVGGEVICYVW